MGIREQAKSAFGRMLRPVRSSPDGLASREAAAGRPASLEVVSAAFTDGSRLPIRFTGDGDNVSPPVAWRNVPEGTRELVLVCEDPDAPMPRPFVHWVAYNISPDLTEIPECVENVAHPAGIGGIRQGRNSMRKLGYAGAAPPSGHGTHRYYFEVFALDTHIEPGEQPDRDDIVRAMRGHVLAYGEMIGTYAR